MENKPLWYYNLQVKLAEIRMKEARNNFLAVMITIVVMLFAIMAVICC